MQLGGEKSFHLTSYSPSWKEVGKETPGKDIEVVTGAQTTEGRCLLAHSPILSQSAFFIQPTISHPGVDPLPTMA